MVELIKFKQNQQQLKPRVTSSSARLCLVCCGKVDFKNFSASMFEVEKMGKTVGRVH